MKLIISIFVVVCFFELSLLLSWWFDFCFQTNKTQDRPLKRLDR